MLFWCFFSPPFHLFFSSFFFIFILFCFFFLFPFCSLDAAKRKAWKLNRVGSLRNIYSSSSTNTEGNKPTRFRWTLPLLPLFSTRFSKNLLPCTSPLPSVGMEIKFAQSMRAFISCLQSHSSWSFHLFVCVFYFTIHVPFSLLKFWPFPLVVKWWCLNYFRNPFSSFIYFYIYIYFPFLHVGTQCNISQVITVFKSVSIRCNDL